MDSTTSDNPTTVPSDSGLVASWAAKAPTGGGRGHLLRELAALARAYLQAARAHESSVPPGHPTPVPSAPFSDLNIQ